MEVLGIGLEALGTAISAFCTSCAFIGISVIIASTFLIYTNKIQLTDLKTLFKKDKKW